MGIYSAERKQSVIRKMMSPHNIPIPQLSREEGISDVTLYTWRKQAREKGLEVLDQKRKGDSWSSEVRFAIVLETATMDEAQLSEYCRQKGLYVEQVAQWKQNCLRANAYADTVKQAQSARHKQDKKRIKELEKELNRKEKALAETAALLVLRKKFNALWQQDEGE